MAKPSPQREAARLQAEQRRRECLALRVGGASIGEIAQALNLSKSTVHGHVKRALTDLAKADQDATARYRALNLQRLDKLLMAIWPAATTGKDIKATREATRASRERVAPQDGQRVRISSAPPSSRRCPRTRPRPPCSRPRYGTSAAPCD